MLASTLRLYQNAYSGHSKEIWALTIFTLVNRMGTMVVPFLTVYLTTELHFSFEQAGIIMAAFGVGSLAGTFSGGKLTDRWGAISVIILSLLLGGLCLLGLQYVRDFYPLMGFIFGTALFGEAYRPAVMAAVGQYVPSVSVGRSMALIRLAMNLGFAIAPLSGGFLVKYAGYPSLFWVDGLTCILASAYLWMIASRWKKQEGEGDKVGDASRKGLSPLRNIPFLMVLLITLMMGTAFIQWFQTVPVFMEKIIGLDTAFIGAVISCNGLIIVLVEMPLVSWTESRGKERGVMTWGLALICVSFLALLMPPSLWWCLLGMLLVSLGEVTYFPLNVSMAIKLCPPGRRGSYMGWYSMTWSMIHIIAPPIGLFLADRAGFSMLWMVLSASMLLCLALHLGRKWE